MRNPWVRTKEAAEDKDGEDHVREWRGASSSKSTEEKQQKERGQCVRSGRPARRGCGPCAWPACEIAGCEASRRQLWPKPSLPFERSSHGYLKWPQRKHAQKFSRSLFLFLCSDDGSGHANDETTSILHLLWILELPDNTLHSVQSRLQMIIDNTHLELIFYTSGRITGGILLRAKMGVMLELSLAAPSAERVTSPVLPLL